MPIKKEEALPAINGNPFPMRISDATHHLRGAYVDSSKFFNTILFGEGHEWHQATTTQRILLVLRDGRIVKSPALDQNGYYQCRATRDCAGTLVHVTFAIEPSGDEVIALKVEEGYE